VLRRRPAIPPGDDRAHLPAPARTVGYEGATVDSFLAALAAAGVDLLVDVRALAVSRRPGFAKTRLAANLAGAGVEYRHVRALGTPSEGGPPRAPAGTPRCRRCSPATSRRARRRRRSTRSPRSSATGGGCACSASRRPRHCHRSLVAAALAERVAARVVHLDAVAPDDD
jgi:hypothetical protein